MTNPMVKGASKLKKRRNAQTQRLVLVGQGMLARRESVRRASGTSTKPKVRVTAPLKKSVARSQEMLPKLRRALMRRDLRLIEEFESQLTAAELQVKNKVMQNATFSVGMNEEGRLNALLAAHGNALLQCF